MSKGTRLRGPLQAKDERSSMHSILLQALFWFMCKLTFQWPYGSPGNAVTVEGDGNPLGGKSVEV